jgi:hypothetical protein
LIRNVIPCQYLDQGRYLNPNGKTADPNGGVASAPRESRTSMPPRLANADRQSPRRRFAKKRCKKDGAEDKNADEAKCKRNQSNSSTAKLFPARPSPDIDNLGGSIR